MSYYVLSFSKQLSATASLFQVITQKYNDVTRPEIKFHVDSISITMVLDVICKIESVFRPTNVHTRFLFRVHMYKFLKKCYAFSVPPSHTN